MAEEARDERPADGPGERLPGVLALSVLFFATLFLAVCRGATSPWALVAVLVLGFMRTIVAVSWKHHASPTPMLAARRSAFALHLAVCIVVAASSLTALRV